MLYCCKDWKNIIRTYFEQVFLFVFETYQIPSLNISFLDLGLENFSEYKKLCKKEFFLLFELEIYSLKYNRNIRPESSISRNIRKFHHAWVLIIPFLNTENFRYARVLNIPFPKCKKNIFLRYFLILESEI